MTPAEAARGVTLTMTAAGPSAVVCTWFCAIAVVGVFGGPQAKSALDILATGGGAVVTALVVGGALRGS